MNIIALTQNGTPTIALTLKSEKEAVCLEMFAAMYLTRGDIEEAVMLHRAVSDERISDSLKKKALDTFKCDDKDCIVCDVAIEILTKTIKLKQEINLVK